VRIYAATRRDLHRLAETGQVLPTLVERMNVYAISVPPLRERGEDVGLIARTFLSRTESKLGKQGMAFTPAAMDALRRYPWPGNVRELENVVERAAALCDGTEIPAEVLAIDAAPTARAADAAGEQATSGRLEDFFVRFVLANQDDCTETELASQLGISRKSLWERRQRLNIPRRRTQKRGSRRSQRSG
jgi:DNA-binding NtrC family response regulator